MQIARALVGGRPRQGEVEGEWFYPLVSDELGATEREGSRERFADLELLAPVAPSKILVVLVGYVTDGNREAARENPIRFGTKLTTAACGSGTKVVSPILPEGWEHPMIVESELAVVIGKRSRRLTPENAAGAIFGFTCLNDIGLRGLGGKDKDFTRSKSSDTFCPMGPTVTTDIDPALVDKGLEITCRINGEVAQSGTTGNYTYGVLEIVAEASRLFTLLPGDVISLGTPPPPPEVHPGDEIEVEVESVGILRNAIVQEGSEGS